MRFLVAAVGNVLRGDDGFGSAVAHRLGDADLPSGVELIESGIGGVALLQEIAAGCDGVVIVDAVDRGEEPGTVFVIEPEVEAAEHIADVHLVNPRRVLAIASAMGVMPPRVRIVGCQPDDAERLSERLSPPVEAAVGVAARRVREVLSSWSEEATPRVAR
jgi:hydrogenase maturation protease